MANFDDQVMGLTGLTISGSSADPSQTELSTFLNDGVLDVTSKWIAGHPQEAESFTRKSAIIDTNGGLDLNGAQIISVIRENEADGSSDNSTAWRPCRKIPASMQSQVVDTESLSFASKYHPVYMIDENGTVHVYPAPDGTNDGYRIYYVNNSPEETDGTALQHSSSGIKYFPNDKIHLVILYASIKTIHAKMSSLPGDLSQFSLTAVPPAPPTLSSTSITITGTAPTYTPPKIGGATEELTTTMDADSAGAGTDADFLNFSKWFSVAGEYIEDQEDSELASIQLNKIGSYISSYSHAMQNQLNVFNDANVEYQALLQKNFKDAQLADAAEARSVQKYSAEVSQYQADVNAEVVTFTQKLQKNNTEYQWYQDQYTRLQNEYNAAFAVPGEKQAAPAGRARR